MSDNKESHAIVHGVINGWTMRLEELVESNSALTIRLKLADDEVACLKIEIKKHEDGHLELVTKLADANNEIGRLGMVIRHQTKNQNAIRNR